MNGVEPVQPTTSFLLPPPVGQLSKPPARTSEGVCLCGTSFLKRKSGKPQQYCSAKCRTKFKQRKYRATESGLAATKKADLKYYRLNRDLIIQKRRVKNLTPQQLLRVRLYSQKRYSLYRAKINALARAWSKKHREHVKARRKAYYETHPSVRIRTVTLTKLRRRSFRTLSQNDKKTVVDWELRVKSKPSFVCHWCLESFSVKQLHIDHIVPFIRGGSYDISNLCCACSKCNTSKKDSPLSQFSNKLSQPVLVF